MYEGAATSIDDEAMQKRLENKKNIDLARIVDRMDKVSIERAYRIIKALDDLSREMKEKKLPMLQEALQEWGRKVLWTDISVAALLLILLGIIQFQFNILEHMSSPISMMVGGGLFVVVMLLVHMKARSFFAQRTAKKWEEKDISISKAIMHNTKWWRTTFGFGRNWHKNTKAKLDLLMTQGKELIQKLNDQFVSASADVNEKNEMEKE
jgi:hypothetical protein